MALVLTAGQRHEQSAFEVLMEQGPVRREGRVDGPNCVRSGWLRTRATTAARSEATCGVEASGLVRVISGDASRSTSCDIYNGIG